MNNYFILEILKAYYSVIVFVKLEVVGLGSLLTIMSITMYEH